MNFNKLLCTALATFSFAAVAAVAPSPGVVYATGSSDPWGNTSNDNAMSTAFGAGNWTKSYGFNTGLFTGSTFVYLDGSDSNALALSAFIGGNQAFIENYVFSGGRLLINAAPNQGGSFNLGFGANLLYSGIEYTNSVSVTADGIAAGLANGGIATNYTGNHFGHALVTGAGISNLVQGNDVSGIVFGGKQFGSGYVAFGGQTSTYYHDPVNDALALRVNELLYVANAVPGNNVPEPAGLALFGVALAGMLVVRRRKV